ncbi:hypothetical protein YA0089_18980 [Pseudomonas viridiflava]|uniref:hypothetical protein n=1 Tax=Pseudomonas viridiflava TaxID=33069 RepID=UPI0018E5F45C|nr:hypothetical protein [Pseudomonas viridiflava]MBI6725692.1 hypothetical protein [Pseudomonas viridiflava]
MSTTFEKYHVSKIIKGCGFSLLVWGVIALVTLPEMDFKGYIETKKITSVSFQAVTVYVNAREQKLNYAYSSAPDDYYTIDIKDETTKCAQDFTNARLAYAFIETKPLKSPLLSNQSDLVKEAYLMQNLCAKDTNGTEVRETEFVKGKDLVKMPDLNKIKFVK